MRLSNAAWELKDQWYMTRPAPEEAVLVPSWKRQDDLVIKVAMALCLADMKVAVEPKLVIRAHHVRDAITLVQGAQKCLPRLIAVAARSQTRGNEGVVEDYVRQKRELSHAQLLKYCSKKGINADEVWKQLKSLKKLSKRPVVT
jgi:hypothetical protein